MAEGSSDWLLPIKRLADSAPLYVAYPLATFLRDHEQNPPNARLALFALCDSIEALVRFLAIARSLEIIGSNKNKAPDWLAEAAATRLVTPTFGQWIEVLRLIIGREPKNENSKLLPELKTLRLLSELFAETPRGAHRERYGLTHVRNPLAHGASISEEYAQELLDHWGPKVAAALAKLSWLCEIELWASEADGFKRLNGPQVDGVSQTAPDPVRGLEIGEVALVRNGHLVKLYPLGRKLPYRGSDRHLTQIFARRDRPGLVYHLFGARNALQGMSDLAELERLDDIFNIRAIRAEQKRTPFGEPNYDNELESDANAFVGRTDAFNALWDAVKDKSQGAVFVSGPAGIGKSSLVARIWKNLLDEIEQRRSDQSSNELVLAYRFIDGERGCTSQSLLTWLIVRVATASKAPIESLTGKQVDELRDMALGLLSSSKFDRTVLVLDGLDELARREQRFVVDLMRRLAAIDRLLVLASARPERGIPEAMTEAGAVIPWERGLPEMNKNELRELLEALVPGLAREFVKNDEVAAGIRNRFVDTLVERAKGLPLYVKLVVQAINDESFSLGDLDNPHWLPKSVVEFFDRIATSGPLRDEKGEAPLVGCLLALAKEPLSIDEIGALLARRWSPDEAEWIRKDHGDPAKHARELAGRTVQELVGLLRSPQEGEYRFRLLHDDLEKYILSSRNLITSLAKAHSLLGRQAENPGNDAVTRYLYRNGIEHIIEGYPDPKRGVEKAAQLLSNFDYQVERLAAVTIMGGDGGIRDDWTRIQDAIVKTDATLQEEPRAWRHFWNTDGTLFEPGEGRDAARELLERVLEYAPDTIVGASYSYPPQQ